MNMSVWPAPAKLNLFLHITGRRADGYHELQTVFQFLDYADELRCTLRHDGSINLAALLPNVAPEHNLVTRAARLLQTETATTLGADIELTKRIPIGGGLGGGSSDAATALVALNQIWGLNLPLDELARLGLHLGADVPVFVYGHAAWAEGVGERLTPISLDEPWYVVVAPPCAVSTQAIFSSPDLTRDTKPITIADFLAGKGVNDCATLVCRRYPEVAEALHWLEKFAKARMTGTGGCVFATFEDEARARFIAQQFAKEHSAAWQVFAARGMNRSPLHRFATKM
ncbi:MAG: 4-(cytidine 5'-diphospho)-2-C-methyl-D-erythritol kinase [Gammaproteobacteria bacterium]